MTNKDTLSKILHIIITILTALAATLTTQSCMKHKASPSNLPDSYPITAITAIADLPATQSGVAVITWLSAEDWRLLQQLIEHERECNALHSSDIEWPACQGDSVPTPFSAHNSGTTLYGGEYINPPRTE